MVVIKLKDKDMYLETYEKAENGTWIFSFCTNKPDAMPFDGRKEAADFMIEKDMSPNLYKIVPKEGEDG